MSYIALGSNLAGRFATIAAAVEAAIGSLDSGDIAVIGSSRLYRSFAWPNRADPEFVNAVIAVKTDLSPAALLAHLHRVEADFGRVRRLTNAPRPLDLDIIDYDGLVSAPGASPILPHPRLIDRAFVLLPLVEIVPDWRHPATGRSIAELISALPDPHGASPL